MAFGATSSVFTQWMINPMTRALTNATAPTSYVKIDAGGDVVNVALFNNSVTPDKDAVVGSTGFNTGTWTTGANEVTDATNWVSGGRPLVSQAVSNGTGFVMFDANDTSGAGNVTLTAAFGCMVYDNTITAGTVAKQGICFNSFGGTQSVTAGTFTIVWHANGLFRLTN